MRIHRHKADRPAGRRVAALTALATGLLLRASPAWAHVYVEPREQLPGRLGTLGFTVPHGCGESPTTRLDIAVPDGVEALEPLPHDGWQAELRTDPATGRVRQLTWGGGSLPSHQEAVFTARARLPDRPGERLWFKVVQTCTEGETRWVELPAAGRDVDELSHPAAHLDLVDPSAPAPVPAVREVSAGSVMPVASAGGIGLLAAGLLALRRRRRGA